MTAFDRIKPPRGRVVEPAESGTPEARPAASDGRAALFSPDPGRVGAPRGSGILGLAVRCSRCRTRSPLDARAALRALFPLFVVAPWRRHQVFAVCPACRRRAWLRLGAPEDPGV